ncbi:hypothetical protein PVAP13_2NG319503 [Panicum virgatum]|uniref:Secreted protein n=1 Tax=Panicum virgatum TaxID=38727 RepID=A0A8T0VR70_PANVG|nr:hypothetical protein PVAP13_2NG319503 [Panicum virgatum]
MLSPTLPTLLFLRCSIVILKCLHPPHRPHLPDVRDVRVLCGVFSTRRPLPAYPTCLMECRTMARTTSCQFSYRNTYWQPAPTPLGRTPWRLPSLSIFTALPGRTGFW